MKLTELPLRNTIPFSSHSTSSLHSLFFSPSPKPSLYPLLKPFSCIRTTTSTKHPRTNQDHDSSPCVHHSRSSAPWLNKWPSPNPPIQSKSKTVVSKPNNRSEIRHVDGSGNRTTAIERIVLRLRNLGLGSDDEEEDGDDEIENSAMRATGQEKLGDLLRRDWVRPDKMLVEDEEDESVLPWERKEEDMKQEEEEGGGRGVKKRAAKAPTLAELTIEDAELRRLRTLGMTIRERISVPKAGITGAVLEKIHDQWRKSELARLKFHETLAHDMKTAHEIVERRSGGLVIWRSGSVMMVFRGSNYAGPSSRPPSIDREGDTLFIPDVSTADNTTRRNGDGASLIPEKSKPVISGLVENMTEEEAEFNSLLDGLGPRFDDWWGTGILPVDADLLPQIIHGYKTPFRLLPTGMRPRLTNAEMTNLRKFAKSLPCHFALGRNRNHQGLAAAIIKLWEKSLVVKIAVKRGIQNTNNELMAEEIKKLTGGVLLLRNKYYIVIYRGKDFLPTSVAAALAERQEMTKQIQDVEEKLRRGAAEAAPMCEHGQALAGTLAEFYEAQAQWGREISPEEHEKMIEAASRTKSAKIVKRLEHKLFIAQSKKHKAEKELAKIRESWLPAGAPDDQETITDEERVMFRRVGLRMKPYLPLGIRGVFDGVIENMHLHWKHRELVKLISKQKELAFVEETARLLEYESGGILVDLVRVPKGYAVIYYRGKNYRQPITLRPRSLPTKARALKRWKALQRYEALSQHISELENAVEQMKIDNGDSNVIEAENSWNSEEHGQLNHVLESTQSEDEASWMSSDGDESEDVDWEDDEDFESPSIENHDFPSTTKG